MCLAEAPLDALSREQKLLLLKRLRAKLKALAAMLAAKQGLSGAAAAPAADVPTGAGDVESVSAHPSFCPGPWLCMNVPVLHHISVICTRSATLLLLANCPCGRQSELRCPLLHSAECARCG